MAGWTGVSVNQFSRDAVLFLEMLQDLLQLLFVHLTELPACRTNRSIRPSGASAGGLEPMRNESDTSENRIVTNFFDIALPPRLGV
jgi:hypothetical protein